MDARKGREIGKAVVPFVSFVQLAARWLIARGSNTMAPIALYLSSVQLSVTIFKIETDGRAFAL